MTSYANFELIDSLFSNIQIRRQNKLPEKIDLQVRVEAKIVDANYPKVEIYLRVSTEVDTPFYFTTEIIGIFENRGEKSKDYQDIVKNFSLNYGVNQLWPNVVQMISMISSQMGMNPIRLKTPPSFSFEKTD